MRAEYVRVSDSRVFNVLNSRRLKMKVTIGVWTALTSGTSLLFWVLVMAPMFSDPHIGIAIDAKELGTIIAAGTVPGPATGDKCTYTYDPTNKCQVDVDSCTDLGSPHSNSSKSCTGSENERCNGAVQNYYCHESTDDCCTVWLQKCMRHDFSPYCFADGNATEYAGGDLYSTSTGDPLPPEG